MIGYLFLSFLAGSLLQNWLWDLLKKKSMIVELNSKWTNILDNIISGESKFVNRYNNSVVIKITIVEDGEVDLMYLIDKNDIAMFKNGECIYTSLSIDSELKKSIINNIKTIYNVKINDTVYFMGNIYSKKWFEEKYKIKIDQLKNIKDFNINFQQNKPKKIEYTIDGLLDKISSDGMQSLSDDEVNFLKNYNKK